MLEVKSLAGVLARHLDKRLVTEGRMIDIFLKFQQSIHGSSKEFRMSQSVRDILVFFLRFDRNIILVSLCMVVISGDWSIQTLLLPLDDVFKRNRLIPDCVGHEAILVGEGPNVFVVNISSRET